MAKLMRMDEAKANCEALLSARSAVQKDADVEIVTESMELMDEFQREMESRNPHHENGSSVRKNRSGRRRWK
jgi:hypothetical protein